MDALPPTSTAKLLKHKLAKRRCAAKKLTYRPHNSSLKQRPENTMQKETDVPSLVPATSSARDRQKFASEGFTVFAGPPQRRQARAADRTSRPPARDSCPLARCAQGRGDHLLPQRRRQACAARVCIFNVGANVNFPILETTERVFRKVWEMACYSGFLCGARGARLMLPRGGGNIFFTGATASLRGAAAMPRLPAAKFGLRAVAQAMARELGPNNIHVAHLIIDSGVDTRMGAAAPHRGARPQCARRSDLLMRRPRRVVLLQLYQQPKSAWTFELKSGPSARSG